MRRRLIERLLKATESMVQGGLSETSRRCGNPNCICHRDPARLHGPHLYITYRVDGKGRSLYVPPEHAASARQAARSLVPFLRDWVHHLHVESRRFSTAEAAPQTGAQTLFAERAP